MIQRLKGLQFCCLEHQELHFGLSFERLRESVTEVTPNKPKQPRFDAKQDLAEAQAEKTQANAEQTPADPVPELQATEGTEETSPTLEIASLVEAVGTDSVSDLPETASFLPELPSRQDQPAIPLKTYDVEELVTASVQLPASPAPEPLLRASRSLVLEVSPAQPSAEVTPITSQSTWRPVPQGYPPVVVSATATLLLDSNGAKMIPLRMGEPYRGKGPVPPPQNVSIETPLPQPRLPSQQPGGPAGSIFAPPPPTNAYQPFWKGRLGSHPPLPQVTGILRPQRDLVRLVPPVMHENLGALSTFTSFAAEPYVAVQPAEPRVAPLSLLEGTISPRRAISAGTPPLASRVFALPKASNVLPVASLSPVPYETSFSELDSAWLRSDVASQLPRFVNVSWPVRTGLNPAADSAPLGWASATSLPPPVATAPAIPSPLPTLLLSKTASVATPVMAFWSSTRALWREACYLPSSASEQEWIQSAAHLQPSLPSPMSLVTWSHSLTVSIPARNPSNLGGPAPVGVSAVRGCPCALRPLPPSRRGNRITPLLPRPNGVFWTPVAPIPTPEREVAIQAIAPGSEGTAPPSLAPVRVQPAAMTVRPPASATFEIEPVNGLVVFGTASEDTLQVASVDVANSSSGLAWSVREESGTVLPIFSDQRQAPAIAVAPSSDKVWGRAIPPAQAARRIESFSALNRLAWSLTASLPGARATPLT
ncbi:MAG: hypothetical protein WBE37_10445 [Bryobacteraceae bacterium]